MQMFSSQYMHQKTEQDQVLKGRPDTHVAHHTIHNAPNLYHLCFSAGAKQAGVGGHADKMLKAHSRDLGQQQQLVHAKLHQGYFPIKSASVSTYPLFILVCTSVLM